MDWIQCSHHWPVTKSLVVLAALRLLPFIPWSSFTIQNFRFKLILFKLSKSFMKQYLLYLTEARSKFCNVPTPRDDLYILKKIFTHEKYFSFPAIPLFLTIPNGFESLKTVYITSNTSATGYQPLYEFEVFLAYS